MTVAEELLVLAFSRDDGKPHVGYDVLDPALGGAILGELALQGRVEVSGATLAVIDDAPLGSGELDDALTKLARSKRRKTTAWVNELGQSELRRRMLSNLTAQGILQRGEVRLLGPARYRVENQSRLDEIRQRIAKIVEGSGSERDLLLIAVMQATKLDRKVIPNVDKKKIAEIVENSSIDGAVASTIATLRAAISAAAFLSVI